MVIVVCHHFYTVFVDLSQSVFLRSELTNRTGSSHSRCFGALMNMCSSASALWHVRSLFVVCLLSLTCGDATATSVQYLYGTYTSSCSQICNAAGLFCADSMIESMNCAAVAKSHCRSSSLSSNPNVGCTVSGCYVNCQKSYYYSKSSSFSSCNTAGTCLTTSSNLYKHCPCYEQASTELEGWAKIGLYLAGAIVLICVVFLVRLGMQQMRYWSFE